MINFLLYLLSYTKQLNYPLLVNKKKFHINGKSSHAARCVKSRIINKFIDYIFSVDTFGKKCVVIKGMLQSPHLEDHMKTIGIDQSVRNRDYFEHNFLNNIKKIYQHAGKCDDQQKKLRCY